MIISRPKPWAEIEAVLEGIGKVFLVGCGECAAVCMSGGEEEVQAAKARLEAGGRQVTGWFVADAACHILDMKRRLRQHKAEVEAAEALLVLSCGAGVQSFAEILPAKPVFAANDTLFLGNVQRFGNFAEHCSLCGACILNATGGICPVTNCPKGLLNGPCGGVNQGKCELDPERECAWVRIYERMRRLGRLDELHRIQPPKDYAQANKPRTYLVERKKGGEK